MIRSQHEFQTQQLPDLSRKIIDLNHRQTASEHDIENLIKSGPVALRKITRDLIEIHEQINSISKTVNQKIADYIDQLEKTSSITDQCLTEIRVKLDAASNRANQLTERLEFVRKELMFEMRYGGKPPLADTDTTARTRAEILNPQKLAAARNEQLRVNLGCGHIALDGYLNIDRRALPGVDIVSEVNQLPFAANEVDEIFSAHLLEHFPQEQLRRELFPYWIKLLKTGGVFRSVVPDADSMIKEYVDGTYPYSSLREVTFGGQDYDGDFHFNMFVPEQMEDLLQEAGLSDVEWKAIGRKNGACYEMEFKATKK
ncbi:class I SAM-dependent methyltransferase [Silvimonas iriomotensis]|nr:hypothetical protein [Silvimonas iriomotensis]